MARRKILTRQEGQRHLGLDDEEDDDVLHLQSTGSLEKRLANESNTGLRSANNTLVQLLFIPQPLQHDTSDCISVCSTSTGIPSLASISAGSMADDSFYSRSQESTSGVSRYGSVTPACSSSLYHDHHEDTVSVASSIVSELTKRSKIRILLREGIEEENHIEAETLEWCLAPVVSAKNDAATRYETELANWGSPPTSQHSCISETTVCRSSFEQQEGRTRDGQQKEQSREHRTSPVSVRDFRRHKLASRNAEAAPHRACRGE
jgi:hypothetical protein